MAYAPSGETDETAATGFTSAVTTSTARNTRNSGLMIRPTHVRILLGRSEKNSTSAKKITENTTSAVPASPPSSGSTPMVKLVAAQRGIAKSGPIVRYSAQVKNTPYPFPTRLLMARRSSERLMPNAATPMRGRPTAVTMKPIAAT